MADLEFYKLSMTGEEADSGIRTGMEAGATSGVLLGDGGGGVTAATPGRDFGFPLLTGNGPPTGNTAANIGQHYFNMQATAAPYEYICVGLNSNGFIWIVFGDTGDGFKISGYFASLEALETAISAGTVAAPTAGTAYGIGEAAPYDIYVWDAVNSEWVNNGPLGVSGGGSGVPPHGETGQVMIKLSDLDGDAGWGQVSTPGIAGGAVTLPKISSTAFDSAPVEGSGKIITSGAVAAALANFTGGVEIVKLWENASPSSDFAAQTVAVNFSGYVRYQIAAYNRTQNVVNVYEGLVGYGMRFVYTYTASGSDETVNRVGMRTVAWTNSGLEFSDGVYNGAVNNGMLLPLAIYGIKGVT